MRFGQWLVEQRIASIDQVQAALQQQVVHGGRLGTNLLEQGALDPDVLATALSMYSGAPAAKLRHFENADHRAIALVGAERATRLKVFPLALEVVRPHGAASSLRGDRGEWALLVAMRDPHDAQAIDELARATGTRIHAFVAPEKVILRFLDRTFGPRMTFARAAVAPDGVPTLPSSSFPHASAHPPAPPLASLVPGELYAHVRRLEAPESTSPWEEAVPRTSAIPAATRLEPAETPLQLEPIALAARMEPPGGDEAFFAASLAVTLDEQRPPARPQRRSIEPAAPRGAALGVAAVEPSTIDLIDEVVEEHPRKAHERAPPAEERPELAAVPAGPAAPPAGASIAGADPALDEELDPFASQLAPSPVIMLEPLGAIEAAPEASVESELDGALDALGLLPMPTWPPPLPAPIAPAPLDVATGVTPPWTRVDPAGATVLQVPPRRPSSRLRSLPPSSAPLEVAPVTGPLDLPPLVLPPLDLPGITMPPLGLAPSPPPLPLPPLGGRTLELPPIPALPPPPVAPPPPGVAFTEGLRLDTPAPSLAPFPAYAMAALDAFGSELERAKMLTDAPWADQVPGSGDLAAPSDDEDEASIEEPVRLPPIEPEEAVYLDASVYDAGAATEAIAKLGSATARDEIGDALATYLGRAFGCGVVFFVRDEIAFGWCGSVPGVDQVAITSMAIPLSAPSSLASAHGAMTLFHGPPPAGALEAHLTRVLRTAPPAEVIAAPVIVRDRVTNIAYAQPVGGKVPDAVLEELTGVCRTAADALIRVIRLQKQSSFPR